MANYSFQDPSDITDENDPKYIKDGSTIKSGNFSQRYPGTEIMKGLTLTIEGGNFTNVKKQLEWTVTGGNWTQVSRCSHLNPDYGLEACAIECSHMVSKDEVWVDGVLIDTMYTYEDKAVI